jgi:hypothetical protein
MATWASDATGLRYVRILKSGATPMSSVAIPAVTGETSVVQSTAMLTLADGDYIECQGYQTTVGALNANAGHNATVGGIFRIW